MAQSQRDLMRKLFAQFDGNRELILSAYVLADEAGEVRRTRNSNGVSSREYAIRLWADGQHHGWLSGKPKATAPKAATSKFTRDPVTIFERPLEEMGRLWRDDPLRPRPSADSLEYWNQLVSDWCDDPNMPILVRKSGHRAILGKLASGRPFIRCDNSSAHWAFMGCFAEARPTLAEVLEQLQNGDLPLAMARTRSEKALLEQGTHVAIGGFIHKSKYGQVNKFSDGRAYKLCHLTPVGLGSRGEAEHFEESTLAAHMKLLLNPSNMIVVPIQYSGVGECQAFLRAFMPEST